MQQVSGETDPLSVSRIVVQHFNPFQCSYPCSFSCFVWRWRFVLFEITCSDIAQWCLCLQSFAEPATLPRPDLARDGAIMFPSLEASGLSDSEVFSPSDIQLHRFDAGPAAARQGSLCVEAKPRAAMTEEVHLGTTPAGRPDSSICNRRQVVSRFS